MADNKLVVFDTRHVEKALLDYLTQVYSQQPLIGLVQPNRHQVLSLVQSVLGMIFEERDRNIVGDSVTDWDVVFASILFGIAPAQILHRQVKTAEQLLEHTLVVGLIQDLRIQVNAHTTLSSYIKWELINTGTMIAAVEKGDQRILDWKEEQDARGEIFQRLDLTRVFSDFREQFHATHGPYPDSQLNAMVLEGVLDMFPQLRVVNKVEVVNHDIAAAYNIEALDTWLPKYMRQVLDSFNLATFGVHIPAGILYECEYWNHILSVRLTPEDEEDSQISEEQSLAIALMRGDYLPPEDRDKAERYILENQM